MHLAYPSQHILQGSVQEALKWLEKLDTIAAEKNQNIEQLVLDIVGNYLSQDTDVLHLGELSQQHQELSKRLEQLEKKDYQIERLTTRLDILEKLISVLQTQGIKTKKYARDSFDDEDFEDEPDEVLTDFLLQFYNCLYSTIICTIVNLIYFK